MAVSPHDLYDNFVLENRFKSILETKVSLSPYITLDTSLEANAGNKKKIVTYLPVGEIEKLANREGNADEFVSTFTTKEYEVGTYQGKTSLSDEEFAEDPNTLDNLLTGMAEQLVNEFNNQAIAEYGKASQAVEVDFSTSTAGYLFGKIVDGIAMFEEGVDNLFLLINKKHQAYIRKQLRDDLKYSEDYVRTGYIGSVAGVNVIVSNIVPDSCIILANKEAVTTFLKKDTQSEQDRDPDKRINYYYIRKVGVTALTDAKKVVLLAEAQSTACAITAPVATDVDVAGTCGADCFKVEVFVNGKLVGEAVPASGAWEVEGITALVSGDKVDAIAYEEYKAPKAATQAVVS